MRNDVLYLLPGSDVNPETICSLAHLVLIQQIPGGHNSTLHFAGGHTVNCVRTQAERIRGRWESYLGSTPVAEQTETVQAHGH